VLAPNERNERNERKTYVPGARTGQRIGESKEMQRLPLRLERGEGRGEVSTPNRRHELHEFPLIEFVLIREIRVSPRAGLSGSSLALSASDGERVD